MSSIHGDDASPTGGPQPTDTGGGHPGASGQSDSWSAPGSSGWQPGSPPGDQAYGQHQYGPQQQSGPPAAGQQYHGQYQQQPYPPQPYAPHPPLAQPQAGYAPQPVWVPPVPVYPYAHWGRRVGAYLIDFAPALVAQIPFWIGYVVFYVRLFQLSSANATPDPDELLADLTGAPMILMIVGFVLMLAAIGWQWYNRWLTAGRTGQSMGKRMLNTKLVAEINGQPIGPVNAFLRDLLHVLDGMVYIGYLWPLWDAKRQTFSDMIMKTVVVDQRVQQGSAASAGAHAQHPYGPA